MLENTVKTFLFLSFTSLGLAKAANAKDPCEPSFRKSCGRLVISMVGAGEYSLDPTHNINEPVAGNKHAAASSEHMTQFMAGDNATIPVQHILLTSDPALKRWAETQQFAKNSKLAGVGEMSVPDILDLVSKNSKTSVLNKAIQSFANDPACKQLLGIKKNEKVLDTDKILPFLKVDVLIDGELTEANSTSDTSREGEFGLSLFKEKGTVGTTERWLKDGTVMGQQLTDALMQRLSGSVVNVFAKTCKSGLIGKVFDNAFTSTGICGCFLSVTDETENDFASNAVRAPFNYAMPDQGAMFKGHTKPGVWNGADNMLSMEPSLLDRNLFLIMNPKTGDAPDFKPFASSLIHRNPLFGFGYTSADSIVNDALEKMSKISSTSVAAKQLMNAEFVKELPEVAPYSPEKGPTASELDQNVERTRDHIEDAKGYLGAMLDYDSMKHIDTTVFDKNFLAFKECVSDTAPKPSECSFFKTSIDKLRSKKASGSLTEVEQNYLSSFDDLVKYFVEIKFSGMFQKLAADKEPTASPEFLSKMWKAKELFNDFKQKTDAYKWATRTNKTDALPEDKEKAFKVMTASFDTAYSSARDQIFNYLRKEAITTKISKLESTINLLAQHASDVPDAAATIAKLASKLNCLTQYAVGPAHDRNGVGPIRPVLVNNTTVRGPNVNTQFHNR